MRPFLFPLTSKMHAMTEVRRDSTGAVPFKSGYLSLHAPSDCAPELPVHVQRTNVLSSRWDYVVLHSSLTDEELVDGWRLTADHGQNPAMPQNLLVRRITILGQPPRKSALRSAYSLHLDLSPLVRLSCQ